MLKPSVSASETIVCPAETQRESATGRDTATVSDRPRHSGSQRQAETQRQSATGRDTATVSDRPRHSDSQRQAETQRQTATGRDTATVSDRPRHSDSQRQSVSVTGLSGQCRDNQTEPMCSAEMEIKYRTCEEGRNNVKMLHLSGVKYIALLCTYSTYLVLISVCPVSGNNVRIIARSASLVRTQNRQFCNKQSMFSTSKLD